MFCTGEPREIPYNELPRLLGAVVRNQQFVGNPYLHQAPMHISVGTGVLGLHSLPVSF